MYIPLTPRVQGRESVRDPINPRIKVALIGTAGEEAAMELTVQQALELSQGLIRAVQEFCKRQDVHDALRRTEPGSLV